MLLVLCLLCGVLSCCVAVFGAPERCVRGNPFVGRSRQSVLRWSPCRAIPPQPPSSCSPPYSRHCWRAPCPLHPTHMPHRHRERGRLSARRALLRAALARRALLCVLLLLARRPRLHRPPLRPRGIQRAPPPARLAAAWSAGGRQPAASCFSRPSPAAICFACSSSSPATPAHIGGSPRPRTQSRPAPRAPAAAALAFITLLMCERTASTLVRGSMIRSLTPRAWTTENHSFLAGL